MLTSRITMEREELEELIENTPFATELEARAVAAAWEKSTKLDGGGRYSGRFPTAVVKYVEPQPVGFGEPPEGNMWLVIIPENEMPRTKDVTNARLLRLCHAMEHNNAMLAELLQINRGVLRNVMPLDNFRTTGDGGGANPLAEETAETTDGGTGL